MAKSTQPEPQLLNEFLINTTVASLRPLALLLTTKPPIHKQELVDMITEAVLNPTKIQELWQQMNNIEQAYISELVHAPTRRISPALFRAKYGEMPNINQSLKLPLLIHNSILPVDVRDLLLPFVSPSKAAKIKTFTERPESVELSWKAFDENRRKITKYEIIPLIHQDTERFALHDLYAVLQLIDLGKIKASDKTKRVGAAALATIAQVLQGGDFYPPEPNTTEWDTVPGYFKAFAWPMLLQSAGLVELAGTKLQLTDAGKKAINQPGHEVIRKIWKSWQKTTLLDEFNRIEKIKGQTGKGQRTMTAVAGRRKMIVQALQNCPANEWLAFDEFSRYMQASGHTFEINRDLWSLYIEESGYGSLGYEGFGKWSIVQGRYLLVFLFEYAATLGLIDVAYIHPKGARLDFRNNWGTDDYDALSRYDGLCYFRINNLGAWCLDLATQYTPSAFENKQVLKILPNMDIVALEPLPPSDQMLLERFTQKTADAVWQLQPTKLLEFLESGAALSEVQQFLQARSSNQLPNTVETMLKEHGERVSQLSDVGTARVIQVQDAALAQLIANDTRLKKLCMVANEHYLVVPIESETAFRRALRDLGYAVAKSS